MYRIMIVDDEVWVKRGLKEQIEWDNLHAELTGEACDGEEAYELALKLRPDIIITDIKMPHMNGIEFMELINRDMPDVRVIVISGYSEFELVQKAMVNKAINYILKPINEKDLNHSLSIAVKEVEKARVEKAERQSLKKILNRSLPALKEKYMNMLISNMDISNHDFQRYMSDLEIKFANTGFQAVSVNICNYPDQSGIGPDENGNDNLSFSIDSIISECRKLKQNFICAKNANNKHEHVILLGHGRINDKQAVNAEAQSFLLDVVKNLNNFLGLITCIGVGRLYENIEHISDSYIEAVHASKKLKSLNLPGILFFDDMKKRDMNDDIAQKVAEYIQNHYNEPITLESTAEIFYLNPSYFSRTFKIKLGENFIDYLTRVRMEKAIKLMRDPSLKTYDIAEMVGYNNTNYFSKLFKKIMGCSPTEYREKNNARPPV